MRVGVIGAGISGLCVAYYLKKAGFQPLVFESSSKLGGVGTCFEHKGYTLDCFYHTILESDFDLLELIQDLGVQDQIIWQNAEMGFIVDDKLYSLNTPMDLLRFSALNFSERVRTGLAALYITRIKRNAEDLDNVLARDWLLRLYGTSVYNRLWVTLLKAKFGEHYDKIPAYWVWSLLNREKNGRSDSRGYLEGGYPAIIDNLSIAIERGGGEIRINTPVNCLHVDNLNTIIETNKGTEKFSAVISTIPIQSLAKIVKGKWVKSISVLDIKYQGVVVALIIARKSLSRFYWTPVIHNDFTFQGIVETSRVIPIQQIGGRHLIYLMKYCSANSETYNSPDEVIKKNAIDGLEKLYPKFCLKDIEEVYVFRTPYVEPVWTLGYLKRLPLPRVGTSKVYLCTTAQAYPSITSWNTCTALAKKTVSSFVRDFQ